MSKRVVVIGSGPGGYPAAITAARCGYQVTIIEKDALGGTCLNRGCIPSKALLARAKAYHMVQTAEALGIKVEGCSFDYGVMSSQKDDVVQKIQSSLKGLLASHQVKIVQGNAKFSSSHELKVEHGGNYESIAFDHAIVATGSEPSTFGDLKPDHENILDSTSFLNLTQLPKSMVIIGGGYIGCEFASLASTLGTKVTIVEALDGIVAAQGKEISEYLTGAFKAKGIEILTGQKVLSLSKDSGVTVALENGSTLQAEQCVLSLGRRSYTAGLNLEAIGIATDSRGAIIVDEHCRTVHDHILAVGDVTGQSMLAHYATHQGILAAESLQTGTITKSLDTVPAVIFTDPEIAMVGQTKAQAESEHNAKTVRYPFNILGKSIASNHTEGYVELYYDGQTKQIFGGHVIGENASNLIAEISLAIQNELTLESIHETIHAHPTESEAWLEASLIGDEIPIHYPPAKR